MDESRMSLGSLAEPPEQGSLSFVYYSHVYQLVPDGGVWTLLRDADAHELASLARTGTGWVVVSPEGDSMWRGATHDEALGTFLDDNEESEFSAAAER